tara:strand:- start:244 stop:783 length:540 start_codon:yes stop_codon:yes gene_type:complete
MGIDYSAGHAMCLEIDDMIKLINGKNKKAILKVVKSFHDSVVDNKYVSDKAKKAVSSLDNLNSKITISTLREVICDYHKVLGEAGKYEGDCQFANDLDGDDIVELWQGIIGVCGEQMPHLSEVRIFDSYRQNDQCPLEVPCFLFSTEDCYVRTISDEGKRLKKLAGGYLNEISWTDVSC